MKDTIYEKSEIILTACINCWNDIDIYRSREFFFTTLGMFSYNTEDKLTMERHFKKNETISGHMSQMLKKRDTFVNVMLDQDGNPTTSERDKTSEELLTEYLEQNFNKIQTQIVKLLRDFK